MEQADDKTAKGSRIKISNNAMLNACQLVKWRLCKIANENTANISKARCVGKANPANAL